MLLPLVLPKQRHNYKRIEHATAYFEQRRNNTGNIINARIDLQKRTVAPRTECYVAKAKGLKQIAWERGFFFQQQTCYLQVR